MTYAEKREKLESKRVFVAACANAEFGGCGICKREKVEIGRLESELGTVPPGHRAKSSGALKR